MAAQQAWEPGSATGAAGERSQHGPRVPPAPPAGRAFRSGGQQLGAPVTHRCPSSQRQSAAVTRVDPAAVARINAKTRSRLWISLRIPKRRAASETGARAMFSVTGPSTRFAVPLASEAGAGSRRLDTRRPPERLYRICGGASRFESVRTPHARQTGLPGRQIRLADRPGSGSRVLRTPGGGYA